MFELIWRSIGALVAVMGFGIVLKVPRRFVWAGIDGAVGWFIYLIVEQTTVPCWQVLFWGGRDCGGR